MRIGYCVLALASHLVAHQVARADVVHLTGGDTLSGTIVAVDEQSLTLQHRLLGEVQFPLSDVTSYEQTGGASPAPSEPPQTASEAPTATPADDDAATTASKPPPAPTPSTRQPGLFGTGAFVGWKHSLSLGFSGSEGNTNNQTVNARHRSQFEDRDNRWLVELSYHLASRGSERTKNEFKTAVTRDWLLTESPWFYFGNVNYQYDQFKAWENRVAAFGGFGYEWLKTSELELITRVGAGATYEFGIVNEVTPEALFGASLIQWKLADNQTVRASNTFYPSLGHIGEFRNVSTFEYLVKIDAAKGMSFKLGVENEYELPAERGDRNNDLKYFGAVVFDF